MIKSRLGGDAVLVTFELPAAVAAASASVCGEFNGWSPTAHPLTRTDGGRLHTSVELAAGRRWRFRYLLDGQRWENDWAADDYVPNEHGGDDSVVDLTDLTALPVRATTPPPGGDGEVSAAATTPAGAASTPNQPPTRSAGEGTEAPSGTTTPAPAGQTRARKRVAAGTTTSANKTNSPTPTTTRKPAKPSR